MTAQKYYTINEPQDEQQQVNKHSLWDKEILINIIKLARPRTWFFIYYSYIIGWINLLNAYTDIEEDQVNLPNRVLMVDQLGLSNLRVLVILLYGFTTVLALLMPFWFKIVYFVSVFDTVFYSLEPLRFKARPLLSMISFSGAVLLPGVASWTLNNHLVKTPPLLIFLGYMFFTYCTLKNLPDYEGDKYAGLRTSATVFKTKRQASKVAATAVMSPFIILTGMLYFGFLSYKYALLYFLLLLATSSPLSRLSSCEGRFIRRVGEATYLWTHICRLIPCQHLNYYIS
jgi:4-hydroxybenzoate polyprenyltransferase